MFAFINWVYIQNIYFQLPVFLNYYGFIFPKIIEIISSFYLKWK